MLDAAPQHPSRGKAPPPSLALLLRTYVLAEIERAESALARSGVRRHGGVHQARKSIRRARAVLKFGHGEFATEAMAVDRRLQRVGRRLSTLRDANAVVETVTHLVRNAAGPMSRDFWRHIAAALLEQRTKILREELATDPGLKDRRMQLDQARRDAAALPWMLLDEDAVRRAIARSERRARRAGDEARDTRDGELRHGWRRRLRRLRQQIVAVKRVTKENASARAEASLAELLDDLPSLGELALWSGVLGREHDLRVLSLEIRRSSTLSAADRKQALRWLRRHIARCVEDSEA